MRSVPWFISLLRHVSDVAFATSASRLAFRWSCSMELFVRVDMAPSDTLNQLLTKLHSWKGDKSREEWDVDDANVGKVHVVLMLGLTRSA
jgi:hypothetical protein